MYNKKAMNDLKKLLSSEFPDSFDRMILFGSRTENVENKYSDYDILVVLKTTYDWKLKRKIRNTSFAIDIDYDILTDIKLISNDELDSTKGELPFIQNALSNGFVI
ncbi:MAG: nucleotidyltransferase domain-containing protein [Candidatus Cloacimonetes bacterium]|nr:nucleotidyltransferase domain-containing protein [Candidatus Cloacimonadota bacterium]